MHVSHYGTDFKLIDWGADGSLRHWKPHGSAALSKRFKVPIGNSDQTNGRVRCGIRKKSQHQHEDYSGDIAVIHMTSTEATAK